ncbi:hypothetical protein [Pengzhenrongella sp.]|uniref:hypothetical protein n=1 Tax=Pengzhenrongella sp. TaxID=2888820 RepID=UPI002F957553
MIIGPPPKFHGTRDILVEHPLLADADAREIFRLEHPVASSAPAQIFLDAILAVASTIASRSDLLVTSREVLLRDESIVTDRVLVADPELAIVLTALQLRSRGVYPVYRAGGGAFEVSKDLFFHAASYALTPAGHVLWSVTLQNEREGAPDRLAYLVQAVMTRVARSLQARDGVLRALFGRSGNNRADDALFDFDSSMLFLSGAFDACAVLVDDHLGLDSSPMSVGWGRKSWLNQVKAKQSEIGSLLATGSENALLFEILGALRNTVHGEGISQTQYKSEIDGDRTLLRLPPRAGQKFIDAMRVVDPTGQIEVRELAPGRIYIEPLSAVVILYPRILRLLNELVAIVAQMASVTEVRIDFKAYPSTSATKNNIIFDESIAASIRRQLWL